MMSRHKTRRALASAFCVLSLTSTAIAQEKPADNKPQIIVDLKPLGAAPDLFTGNDAKYEQRGIASLFWLGNDRLAVAFSTNRRWSSSAKPEPLHIRLIVFDRNGKQQNARDWDISADGLEAASTLQLAPGPDGSILAVHVASDPNPNVLSKIPDGDFIQVLNPDTSLRQDFYVPATSAWVPNVAAEAGLLLETFYADKHTSIAWWSGHPLKAGAQIDLPPSKEDTTAGPGVAARGICIDPNHCTAIRVFTATQESSEQAGAKPPRERALKPSWIFSNPSPDLNPVPELFLSPTALIVELADSSQQRIQWLIAHPDGGQTALPALPKGLQVISSTSIAIGGQRFAVNAAKQVGICGALELWCKEQAEALVIDVPSRRILFQQPISAFGGTSALSPDGHAVAIFDHNKLVIYPIP
jgi:hypothetical protein